MAWSWNHSLEHCRSGYSTIATCSPKNFDLVKSYGADHVFDYSHPDTPSQIKTLTRGTLKRVLDCISDHHAITVCHEAIGRLGGRLVNLELAPDPRPGDKRRRIVKHYFVDGKCSRKLLACPWSIFWLTFHRSRNLWGWCTYRQSRLQERAQSSEAWVCCREGRRIPEIDGWTQLAASSNPDRRRRPRGDRQRLGDAENRGFGKEVGLAAKLMAVLQNEPSTMNLRLPFRDLLADMTDLAGQHVNFDKPCGHWQQ